jgi:hypothetical protein
MTGKYISIQSAGSLVPIEGVSAELLQSIDTPERFINAPKRHVTEFTARHSAEVDVITPGRWIKSEINGVEVDLEAATVTDNGDSVTVTLKCHQENCAECRSAEAL